MWAYRDGARSCKIPAKDVASEFERIKKKHGTLKASVLLEESRDESAPCHGVFEWNDTKAAHQYRLSQARTLIRDIVYIEEENSEPLQFYHVPSVSGGEGHYEFITRLVNVRSEYQAALGELLTKLESVESSVKRLLRASSCSNVAEVLDSVSGAISQARKDIQELPSKDYMDS